MIYINTDEMYNKWYSDIKESYICTGDTAFVMKIYNPTFKQTKNLYIYDSSSTSDKNIFTIVVTHNPLAESGYTSTLYVDNWLGYNEYEIYYISGKTDGNFSPSEIYLLDSGFVYIYNEYINNNFTGYVTPYVINTFNYSGFTYL